MGLRERPPREPPRQRDHQPALTRPLPDRRRGLQPARVPAGLLLQGRSADGAREDVQGVVKKKGDSSGNGVAGRTPLEPPPRTSRQCRATLVVRRRLDVERGPALEVGGVHHHGAGPLPSGVPPTYWAPGASFSRWPSPG